MKYQWLRRFWLSKWHDRLCLLSIIVGWVMIVLSLALLLPDAYGHGIHFSEVNNSPIVRMGRDKDNTPFVCYQDGECWVIYKDGDLTHSGLHVINANNHISTKGEDQKANEPD